MERFSFCAGVMLLLAASSGAQAQTSLQVIQDDIRTAKQQHDDVNSQMMTSFFSALDTASASPSAALDLYQRAGGTLPNSTPVQSRYDYETPTEKEAREARDAQNLQAQGALVQVHCGLMRNAARLMLTPNAQGVHADWVSWLQSVAPSYPQLVPPPEPTPPPADQPSDQPTDRHHHHTDSSDGGSNAGNAKPPAAPSLKTVTMKDSVISTYLGFHGWGDSEQGKWAVKDLPKLYYAEVLTPLRQPVSPAVIDAWNVYIAMMQTDEPDQTKWTQEEEPELDFERAADDFALQPNMDKLAALDAIIKANPTNSHLDGWISRMQGMIDVYQGGGTVHTPLPGPTPSTPTSDATGSTPMATPGTTSSEAAGTMPTATPGAPEVAPVTSVSGATPGTTSSATGGPIPTGTPGASPITTTEPSPEATPGTTSSATGGPIPTATPGSPSSGSGAPLPTATPGTPASATGGPIPTATPGTPTSGTVAPATATP